MKDDESDGSIYIYIYIYMQLIDTNHVSCNHILRYMPFIKHLTLQNIIIFIQNNFFK